MLEKDRISMVPLLLGDSNHYFLKSTYLGKIKGATVLMFNIKNSSGAITQNWTVSAKMNTFPLKPF